MGTIRNPIATVCSHCGSKDVSRDAWGDWDQRSQEWVLRTVLDASFCHRCDRERSLIDLPLDRSNKSDPPVQPGAS